jgi:hypothetical protein
MLQRFLVAAIFFGGQLFGAFVQLRSHVGGFFRRATEGDEDLGEMGDFHAENLMRKTGTQETESKLFLISCVPHLIE